MKAYIYNLCTCLLALGMFAMSGCDKDEKTSDFLLDVDTYIEKIMFDENYEGIIDNSEASVTVNVPYDYDTKAMTVSQLVLSEGAEASIKENDKLNLNFPQNVRVTNGDAYFDYTVNVNYCTANILSFKLNDTYQGNINNEAGKIIVYVPENADVTNMVVDYEVEEGAIVSVEKNAILDFTTPIEITVEIATVVKTYKVTVIKSDDELARKAFVGIANTIDELPVESKAAAKWMIDNIPNSVYMSLSDIKDGKVRLEDYEMIWCHWDWTNIGDWPSLAYDTKDKINAYWKAGGNIFASREAVRYVKQDMWGVSSMNAEPNNMWGEKYEETNLDKNIGFSVKTYESHEIYDGIATIGDDKMIYLRADGCKTTNRALQWGVDWEPYESMDGWKEKTGATPLASGVDNYDLNRVCIASYASDGTGTVITVGAPAFEWKDANVNNEFFPNMEKLTKNIINYLCK